MNWFIYRIFLFVIILNLNSCKKYLDLKPDNSLYIPSSLRDCQALLDDYSVMNLSYPSDGESSADNYYLTDPTWSSLFGVEFQDTYIWSPQSQHKTSEWSSPYKIIFNSNTVLKILEKIDPSSGSDYNEVKGSALFYRGYTFYSLASQFCNAYDITNSTHDLGIPLYLSTEADAVYPRGSVQQTYDRIISDLKDAVELLPETTNIKSRPTKAAALAALARIYLSMSDYTNAAIYSDACLKKYNTLLNYNSLTANASLPFTRFNSEVIFQALMQTYYNSNLSQTNAKILKSLYDSYSTNDIRKTAFFKPNTDIDTDTYAFKGSYDGSTNLFSGLATDEVYLIRAECYARTGKIAEAMADLNTLLSNRYINTPSSPYINAIANSADEAISIILTERRKELLFRGVRWTDLRRLNKESKYATTLKRIINGTEYNLPPNDLRYTLLIPLDIINNSSTPQNPR